MRVLDWTDESGRLAGKLLAEAGASVLRLRGGEPGPPLPGEAGLRGGTLAWWFDSGVDLLPLDTSTSAGREVLHALVPRADIVIETATPSMRDDLGFSPRALREINGRLVHVSITPYGGAGPRCGYSVSDLSAAALGGVLAVSGTPDAPLNAWGRQCFNVAGLYAATAAVAGLQGAHQTGCGTHFDLSLIQAVASCTEQLLMYWLHQSWFPGGAAPRQGSLHWTGLYEVLRCAVGHVSLAVAPDLRSFFGWMIAEGGAGSLAESPPGSAAEAFLRAKEIMEEVRRWAASKDAAPFALEGQRRGLAFGEVRDVVAAAQCPQLAARGFHRRVQWSGPEVRLPGPLVRFRDEELPQAKPPPIVPTTLDDALRAWGAARAGAGSPPAGPVQRDRDAASERDAGVESGERSQPPKPLQGLRILDLTWVLAGPFATRILADLGADVVKIQTEARSQGANSNEFPFFLLWNRGKRGVTLNLQHERGPATFRGLVEKADVVIDNFSHGVLDRLGVGYEAARAWNPGIIYVSMAGCGGDGPWRDHVTYAPTIHALCGLTALTNPAGRTDIGLGVSLSDHASGLAAALAIVEALEVRRRSGAGRHVDLSQLEVGAHLVGPALVAALSGGPVPSACGNRDPFSDPVPNEVYRCLGDGWIAITARDDHEWSALTRVLGARDLADDPALATADGRRAARERIDARIAAWARDRQAEELMRELQARGITAGCVQTARDLTEGDEQLAARAWLQELPHATLGSQIVDRFPAYLDGAPVDCPRSSPALGEHNFEVYAELLGLDEAEIAMSMAEGLFA